MRSDNYAYRLAPWRKQVKMILTIIFTALFAAVIAMVYLSISADMTDVKLKIQVLQEDRNALARDIADLITEEGILTSYARMEERAKEAGFYEIDFANEDIYSYVVMDGYSGVGMTPETSVKIPQAMSEGLIKPEYSQSLQQWLSERIAVGILSNESQY